MEVAVIGGTGLISGAIVTELVARGDRVTVLNRGVSRSTSKVGVRHVRCDRHDKADLADALRGVGELDALVDMVGFTETDAQDMVDAACGAARQIVFCSTVEVYTKPAMQLPIHEDASCEPTFAYGASKLAYEGVLRCAEAAGDLAITVVRPAYTYGEERPPIYPLGDALYLERVCAGAPIVVPGDGTTWWAGAHRDDVAKAFVAAVGNPIAFGKTYNLSGGDPMTWLDWHRRAADALGAPEPEFVFIPGDLLSEASPDTYAPRDFVFTSDYMFDISAAQRDLEFRSSTTWEDGVRRVHRWQSKHGVPAAERLRMKHDDLVERWFDLRTTFLEGAR